MQKQYLSIRSYYRNKLESSVPLKYILMYVEKGGFDTCFAFYYTILIDTDGTIKWSIHNLLTPSIKDLNNGNVLILRKQFYVEIVPVQQISCLQSHSKFGIEEVNSRKSEKLQT